MPDSPSEAVPAAEPAENPDVNASAASTEGQGAESPDTPAGGEGVEKTLLGAVTAALKKGQAESPAVEDGTAKAEPSEPKSEGTQPDDTDLTEDELKKLHPRTQNRIRHLNDQVKTLNGEVEKLRPGAELSDQILGYMESHGISPDEFQNVMTITALIKAGRHEEALGVLSPVYQELLNRTGHVLPADLQEAVRLGRITEQHARELSQARAKAANANSREMAAREASQKAEAASAWSRQSQMASDAATAWDRAKAAADPDWHVKQPLVAQQIELELRRGGRDGFPKTPAEVNALADRALKAVEAQLKGLMPKPKPTAPVPANEPASARQSAAKPKSYMEAIRLAANGG